MLQGTLPPLPFDNVRGFEKVEKSPELQSQSGKFERVIEFVWLCECERTELAVSIVIALFPGAEQLLSHVSFREPPSRDFSDQLKFVFYRRLSIIWGHKSEHYSL